MKALLRPRSVTYSAWNSLFPSRRTKRYLCGAFLFMFGMCFSSMFDFMVMNYYSVADLKNRNLQMASDSVVHQISHGLVTTKPPDQISHGVVTTKPSVQISHGVVTTKPPVQMKPPVAEPLEGETFCQYRKRTGGDLLNSIWEPTKLDKDKSSVTKQHAEDKRTCIIPKLDPCDPQIMKQDTKPPMFKCPEEENWVYVKNGTFRISQSAIEKYDGILCEYVPIYRDGDFNNKLGLAIKPMLDGTPILTDAFQASCVDTLGQRYHNVHLGVPNIPELQQRAEKIPLSPTALGGYDFLLFGFDSVSRMSWMRNLPKTREYFLKTLGAVELEGHNILGDGTTNNLLPLLAGRLEQELPSSRREDSNAVFVDEFPFIFKDLQKAGYVTMWSEDVSYQGTFTYRLKGFKEQPVDHYLRPYFMTAEALYNQFPYGCIGSESRHVRFMNYFRDAYHMYGKKRKFMFGFHTELSHEDNNRLKSVDEDLLKFLKEIKASGYLDNTILILMADHGARFSQHRTTQQGKLEERLPYFGISLPPSFKSAYPDKVNNLINNRHHLTTMFDVHETIREVMNNSANRPTSTLGRGISLFQPIPTTRNCAQCGVEPHWCTCLSWENVAEGDAIRNKAVESIVNYFNNLTESHKAQCERLKLKNISSIARYRPQKAVLDFKKSADHNGFVPDLSDKMEITHEHLQVTLTTTPGDGIFETTVTHHIMTGEIKIRSEDISRTNKYGDDPACISESFPNLRPYCYCKSTS